MKIHIHGNCQSMAMALMLREVHPEWNVTYFEVHADPIITRNEDYRAAIQGADIILMQPVHDGYRGRSDLSSGWVRSEARHGCEIVVIPSMHFEGYHPGNGYLGLGSLCGCPLTAHLSAAGILSDVAVDMLLSPDLFDETFVRQEAEISLAEMVNRETLDGIDIPLSPVAHHLFAGQFFHIANHPARPLCAYVLTKAMERLCLSGSISPDGVDYQSNPHIPPLPTISRYIQATDDMPAAWRLDLDLIVQFPNLPPMSQREYCERMMGQLSQHSAEDILAAIRRNHRMVEFLARLSRAGSNVPGLEVWECG